MGFYAHQDFDQPIRLYDNKNIPNFEEFKQLFDSNDKFFLKIILNFDSKVKVINYRLNYHWIRNNDSESFHSK